MINFFLKSSFYQRIKEFQSFILLIFLLTLTVLIINFYERFKNEQLKDLNSIFQNIYLQKTLKSISNSLEPRYEKITYIIKSGDSFEGILNDIELDKKEISRILEFIIKNKVKFNIYENQKIIFDIDNLETKKIVKLVIPINKKRDLIISSNEKNNFKFSEITKELALNRVYKENVIKNSLYKAAIDKKIDPNIIVQFAQIYGFQVDFQRDIRKNDSF